MINSMDYSVLFFRILNIILCFRLKQVKNICFITYVPNNSKIKLLKKPSKQHAFSTHYNLHACANSNHVESIFCHDNKVNQSLGLFFSLSFGEFFFNFAHFLGITSSKTYQNFKKFYKMELLY